MKILLRLATPSDFPTIEKWRGDHFARMAERIGCAPNSGIHTSLDSAVWVIAECQHGALKAAISFLDDNLRLETTVFDLYIEPSVAGKRCGLLCIDFLLKRADDMRHVIKGETDCVNMEYRAVLHRFGFHETNVLFERAPGRVKEGVS